MSVRSASLLFVLAVSACAGEGDPLTTYEASPPATAVVVPTTNAVVPTTTSQAAPTFVERVRRASPVEFLAEPDDLRSKLRELGLVPLVLQTPTRHHDRKLPYQPLFGPFCPSLNWMAEPLNAESASSVVMLTDSAKNQQAREANPAIPTVTVEVVALFGVTTNNFQDALDEINAAAGGQAGCETTGIWTPTARSIFEEDFKGSSLSPFLFESLPVADRTMWDYFDAVANTRDLKVFTHINPVFERAMVDRLGKKFQRHSTTYYTNVFFQNSIPTMPRFSRDEVFAYSFGNKHRNMIQRSLFHFPEHEVAIFIRIGAVENNLGIGEWGDLSPDEWEALRDSLGRLHGAVSMTTYQKLIAFADGTVTEGQP